MSPSPKSPESEKQKKYDRQLRLWGDHGQSALESAHICLINATATGTEILKSIVLPGIGAFTIVDGHKVSGEDAGNNFFLDKQSIGKSRAQVASQLLLELNSHVRGDFVDETVENLLEQRPNYFDSFSVVIATNLAEKTLLTLGARLWEAGVALLVCKCYGMIGYMRLQINEHTVIETHPENELGDLRLDKPFPGLSEYVDSINLDQMTNKEHSHTPYLVILMKYLREWSRLNEGRFPKNYKEKESLKQLIRNGIRKNENGIPEEEENFEEAIKAVNTAIHPTEVPNHVKRLFKDPACSDITCDSKPFWILTQALKRFVEGEGSGALPLRGTIPDMTADSKSYVQLQNVYRARANKDADIVMAIVQNILSDIGKDAITENEVRLFCKHSYFLRMIRGRSLAEEYQPKSVRKEEISSHLDNPDSEMIFYAMLRAVDRFHATHNRYPGYFNDQVETDIVNLKSCLNNILSEWGCAPLSKDDYVHEMCRYGASEPHSVAAFMGGCAAQEAIKLITAQYVPFNNTYVYNAMTATSSIYEL